MPVSWKSILDMSFTALNTTHWPNHSHFTLWCYLIFTFQQSNRKIFTQGFSIHHTAVIELNKRPASVPFLAYSFGRCHCPWMQGWRDDQAANESDFSFFILCLQYCMNEFLSSLAIIFWEQWELGSHGQVGVCDQDYWCHLSDRSL